MIDGKLSAVGGGLRGFPVSSGFSLLRVPSTGIGIAFSSTPSSLGWLSVFVDCEGSGSLGVVLFVSGIRLDSCGDAIVASLSKPSFEMIRSVSLVDGRDRVADTAVLGRNWLTTVFTALSSYSNGKAVASALED